MLTEAEKLKCKSAHEFAKLKHEGQTRKEGIPYITHPEAVATMLYDMGYGIDYIIAGLFHDLLEDTDATEEQILALSSSEAFTAVKLLTKPDGYKMDEYVGALLKNPIAKAVKACDRLHNLQSAVHAGEAFRLRYIKESVEWYLDLHHKIPEAVVALSRMTPNSIELLPESLKKLL